MAKKKPSPTEFGLFVNEKCFDRYVTNGVQESYDEDDIVEMFEQFTATQMKETFDTQSFIQSWIEAWLEIFPRGIKSGGKPIRSTPKDCTKRMLQFFKDYPEYADVDLIMLATNEYIKQKSRENFEYTRCAIYFIGKRDEGSDLATWCEECKNMERTSSTPYVPNEPVFHQNDFI